MYKRLGAGASALVLTLALMFGACGTDRGCYSLDDATPIAAVQGRPGSSGGMRSSGGSSGGGFRSSGGGSRPSSSGSRTSSGSRPSSSGSSRSSASNSSRTRPPSASMARRNPPPARYRASDTARSRASRNSAINRLPGGRLPSRIRGNSYRYPGVTTVFVYHPTGFYHYGGYHNPYNPYDWTNYYNPLSPWYMHSMSYAGYNRC